MPSTTHGLPYPNPTEPVSQGAANIQALATSADQKIGRTLLARASATILRGEEKPVELVVDLANVATDGPVIVGEPPTLAELLELLGLPPDLKEIPPSADNTLPGHPALASLANVQFTNIPQTYQSLEVIYTARGSATGSLFSVIAQANGDNTAKYDSLWENVLPAVAGAEQYASTSWLCGFAVGQSSSGGHWARGRCLWPDYVPFSHERMMMFESYAKFQASAGGQASRRGGGSWRAGSAITALAFYIDNPYPPFEAGSQFSLYGLY